MKKEREDRMQKVFREAVEANPIIAAVKDEEGLKSCCENEEIGIVFLLFGDICSISGLVGQVHRAGKIAMVHMDLIGGLSPKEISVDYLKYTAHADGILTTKNAMIQRAKELQLFTVLRVFVIDSMALKSIENLEHQHSGKPDFLEVMPGAMPKVLRKIKSISRIPLIAGGLIADKEDVMGALLAGASAVSTSRQDVWEM